MTSSASTSTHFTESIVLTKGTWLIVATVPVVESGTPSVRILPQVGGMDEYQFGTAQGDAMQTVRILSVPSDQAIYAGSASSSAVQFNSSYLSRGGIVAVKIG